MGRSKHLIMFGFITAHLRTIRGGNSQLQFFQWTINEVGAISPTEHSINKNPYGLFSMKPFVYMAGPPEAVDRDAYTSGPVRTYMEICVYLHVDVNGSKAWYVDDKLHRLDGPAYEGADGSKQWYVDDKLHRLDGPAIEYADGSKRWYVDGKRHRLDGPAVEGADGSKYWYVDDKLHRLDGPAYEGADGSKHWYVNGNCHRLDGPAVERADGSRAWYVDDKRIDDETLVEIMERHQLSYDWRTWTESEKLLFRFAI
jgi:hypothetical protein